MVKRVIVRRNVSFHTFLTPTRLDGMQRSTHGAMKPTRECIKRKPHGNFG